MKNYNVFYLEVVIWQEGLNIFMGELDKLSESTLKRFLSLNISLFNTNV